MKINRVTKSTMDYSSAGIAVLTMFCFQVFAGIAGHFAAGLLSYERIDPWNIYAAISVHHFVQMIIALAAIVAVSRKINIDFYFGLGDREKGRKCLAIFTSVFIFISLTIHIIMRINNTLPVYNFPLDTRNILGTLGFQLLLSGTSEEILYRALPITVLSYVFGQRFRLKGNITLEALLASCLFAAAHVKWSLGPLLIKADCFLLLYAFILGTIQGIAYQESRSVVYPVLMHSVSNVLMVGTGYVFALLL